MSGEISKIAKIRLESTLERISVELEETVLKLEEARSKGDLSENTEYDLALAEFIEKRNKKSEIESILENSEVKESYPTNISNGALISVKLLSVEGEDTISGLYLFDSVGGVIFDGTITSDGPLGREIQGGTSGVYTVKAINGVDLKYQVTLEPESRVQEYLSIYPPERKQIFDRIFDV